MFTLSGFQYQVLGIYLCWSYVLEQVDAKNYAHSSRNIMLCCVSEIVDSPLSFS